jgi:hypothetical protein
MNNEFELENVVDDSSGVQNPLSKKPETKSNTAKDPQLSPDKGKEMTSVAAESSKVQNSLPNVAKKQKQKQKAKRSYATKDTS